MKITVCLLLSMTTGVCAQDFAPSISPTPPDPTINRNPINIVAVGYDIGNNPDAQQMLQDMKRAADDAGVIGEVIMAGQGEEDLDQAMQKAVSIATKPGSAGWKLDVKTLSVKAGEKITVVHSEVTIEDKHAWIAFYEKDDDRDQDYISYTFLNNLTERTYDVSAPRKFGNQYHFRIFKTQAYDSAARSKSIEVK